MNPNGTLGKRLTSLDALRGMNLFFLVAFGPVVMSFCQAVPAGHFDALLTPLTHLLTHEDWEGLTPWDLIMPLFMFMSSASIPFSMAAFRREHNYKGFARRLAKRVVLLWLIGMVVQGGALNLDPDHIYLYTNTLQSIAAGYTIAALFFMFGRVRSQIAGFVLLLLLYWGAMEFIGFDGFGHGLYDKTNNLAEYIDRAVLGRFRDGASVLPDGTIDFPASYTYTWVLSTLTFGATSISGLLCGTLCKSAKYTDLKKVGILLASGAACAALGWLWHLELPVIKHIWTSSMVLVATGYSLLLMGLFYWWYDYRGQTCGREFFRTYGLNSIVAYFLEEVINFKCIPHSLFHGLEQYIGDFYPCLLALGQAVIIYVILVAMRRLNIFVKV